MLRQTFIITISIAAQLAVLPFAGAAEKTPKNATEKMDLETHTLVVEKLRSVLKNDLKDVARAPIQLRLADVLAERARLKAQKEVEANCDDCQQSKEDRKEALNLYESAFANESAGPAVDKGAVLMQMAHLDELLGQNDKAAKIYEQAISSKGKYSKHTIASSYSSLADYKFTKGEFSKSKELYLKALAISSDGMKGSITYRLAWCKLNLGETAEATALIKKVLSTPELMSRETPDGLKFDQSFQEDVSRDLATFLARGTVTQKEIETLKQLSPEAAQKTNVEYLATETDRLGNKKASLLAWDAYLQLEPNKEERIEAAARIARLYFEYGAKEQAVKSLGTLAEEYNKANCTSEPCNKAIDNTRKLIGDWAKSEKKAPTIHLLAAYQVFLKMKPQDLEMIFWAANLARELKQNQTAIALFRQASSKGPSKFFEASLLSEIEIAELTKDKVLKTSAYNNYLALNPNGAKAWEVKYQLAFIDNESGKVASAVEQFHTLALAKPCNNTLCVKAADLALDGLVTLKDEAHIETFAIEFAKAYPSQASSYLKIARTSVTNQVIRISKTPNLSQSEALKGLARIQAVPMAGASESEVSANLKLQILLAEKAGDINQVIAAANKLAAQRSASVADKTFAVGKLAWAYEMTFDFDKAYHIVKNIDVPRKDEAQHQLRLAVLADLAGENPSKHEDAYLKMQPRGTDATLLRAKKVRRASNPKAEFQRQAGFLAPELAGQLALEIFAKTSDSRFADKVLVQSKLRKTEAARTYVGLQLVSQIVEVKRQLSHQALVASNDAVLAKSLEKRMQLLHQLDRLSVNATQLHDWSSETLAVAGLAQENQRLYAEIMNLPIPRRLKAQQRAQYQAAVASKAAPFAKNAMALNERAEQLWNESRSLDLITEGYKETPAQYRKPLVARIKALETQAPSSAKSQLQSALSNKSDSISSSELLQARRDAQKQPFNASAVSRLKELEAKAGRDTMVAYLDGRLSMLKQTGRM